VTLNILLVGETASFPGFKERLQSELLGLYEGTTVGNFILHDVADGQRICNGEQTVTKTEAEYAGFPPVPIRQEYKRSAQKPRKTLRIE